MTSWTDLEHQAPALTAQARKFFDAHVHKTVATLRRDGTPRISGIETIFAHGELWFGSMWRARKALDLVRDPRFALHSGSDDPPAWTGDAKVSGVAEEIMDGEVMTRIVPDATPGGMHLFKADITELVVVSLNTDRTKLVIESWREGRGVSRIER